MLERQKLKFASFLYKNFFPVYRKLYFNYKFRKDKHNLALIRALVKPGSIILDIGANIGFFTKFFSGLTGNTGHVYSFEPDNVNYEHLSEEMKNIGNVTLIQNAVAAESGKLNLYTSSLLNVDHRTYEPENYAGSYSVEKISVDDFVDGKFTVDFIKMDIQGFEMEALRGMINTLNSNEKIILLTELWPYGLEKAGSSAAQFYDFISANGFKIYKAGFPQITLMSREEILAMNTDYFTDANVLLSKEEIFLNL